MLRIFALFIMLAVLALAPVGRAGEKEHGNRMITGDCMGYLVEFVRGKKIKLDNAELQSIISAGKVTAITLPSSQDVPPYKLDYCLRDKTTPDKVSISKNDYKSLYRFAEKTVFDFKQITSEIKKTSPDFRRLASLIAKGRETLAADEKIAFEGVVGSIFLDDGRQSVPDELSIQSIIKGYVENTEKDAKTVLTKMLREDKLKRGEIYIFGKKDFHGTDFLDLKGTDPKEFKIEKEVFGQVWVGSKYVVIPGDPSFLYRVSDELKKTPTSSRRYLRVFIVQPFDVESKSAKWMPPR